MNAAFYVFNMFPLAVQQFVFNGSIKKPKDPVLRSATGAGSDPSRSRALLFPGFGHEKPTYRDSGKLSFKIFNNLLPIVFLLWLFFYAIKLIGFLHAVCYREPGTEHHPGVPLTPALATHLLSLLPLLLTILPLLLTLLPPYG